MVLPGSRELHMLHLHCDGKMTSDKDCIRDGTPSGLSVYIIGMDRL